MTVTLIFRKKNPLFFSIERVFAQIADELRQHATVQEIVAPFSGVAFPNLQAIRTARKNTPADIYHITGDIYYAVFALPRRRTMVTFHDLVFLYQTSGWKRRLLKKLLLDWPVRRAALITTISEATKQDILRHTRCDPGKIVVIPNPMNQVVTDSPLSFRKERPTILFIGSTPNKNLLRVIPALAGIPCELHLIAGLSAEAEALLATHRIVYRREQGLSDQALAEAYNKADMVLFPSTFEGFGLPIIEAQKAGRPVITSFLPPMKDVAGNGALLVDPYSIESIRAGVLRVIGDDALRDTLIAAGRENIRRFDARTIAQQYLACYRQLLA